MREVKLPPIVGLCGDIGCGKSTVSKFLQGDYQYVAMSFAAKLKDVAQDVFGLEPRHVHGTQADKAEPLAHVRDRGGNPRTPRYILEYLGTEGFRHVDPDVWVNYAMRDVDRRWMFCSGLRFVFEDVRFPNEFAAIRERGGVVWEVVRVGGPEQGGRTGHESDDAWRYVRKDDMLVARHGELDALKCAAANALLKASGA